MIAAACCLGGGSGFCAVPLGVTGLIQLEQVTHPVSKGLLELSFGAMLFSGPGIVIGAILFFVCLYRIALFLGKQQLATAFFWYLFGALGLPAAICPLTLVATAVAKMANLSNEWSQHLLMVGLCLPWLVLAVWTYRLMRQTSAAIEHAIALQSPQMAGSG